MVHVACALLMYALWWEKPQDISEPAVQDLSGNMDLLAALLTMSIISSHYPVHEASDLVWYGKKALQGPLLDRPSNERRYSSLEPSGPQYEVKVLRKTPQSQNLEPSDRSKGQVVALVPGQALNCGIGPTVWIQDDHRITYLSTKDVLRWSKLSEWLDKYEQRNPRHEIAVPQSEDLDYDTSLWMKLLNGQSGRALPDQALLIHVSDFPGASLPFLNRNFWFYVTSFVFGNKVLLALLVALPLIYRGIHLTTWNFHFASQIEHLLWKIACIDIMGTIPLGVIFFACIWLGELKADERLSSFEAMFDLVPYISWIFATIWEIEDLA